MPGPAKHKRKKKGAAKSHGSSSSRSPNMDPCVDAIDEADGWTKAAKIACKVLDLPGTFLGVGITRIRYELF